MERCYLSVLPPEIRMLGQRIEDYAGLEIAVRETPQRRKASCLVDHTQAVVCLPRVSDFLVEAFLHELLHIERNWPEKGPQLFTTHRNSQQHVNLIGSLDNQLEHLVIVPRQTAYGFDSTSLWDARLGDEWRGRFWESIDIDADRRLNLLMSYLTVAHLVADNEVVTIVHAALYSLGLLEVAQKFSAEISGCLDDKAKVAAVTKRFLGLPDEEIQLIWFDVQGGREQVVPIAAYS